MDQCLTSYRVGQVVVSKRGKDVGKFYVIVGFLDGGRLALADARRFNVSKPKAKNPKHIQSTSRWIAEIVDFVKADKDIDHGRFRQFLSLRDALVDGRSRNGEAG